MVASAVALAVMALLAAAEPATAQQPQPRPRLLVLLVVDQARADYFVKLRPHLTHGLKRLLEASSRFENAHHAHALTATGPGHASLATGAHPGRSGIVGNRWYDRDAGKGVYCVGDAGAAIVPPSSSSGRSPVNLLSSALPDWIKAADAESKAYSVAGKDRAAVLLGGKAPDGAFWYGFDSGAMVTSRHYAEALPVWARDFNDARSPARRFGRAWKALPTTAEQRSALGVPTGDAGAGSSGFSHLLGGLSFTPGAEFFSDFGKSGLLDAHLGDFVAKLVRAESLGADEHLDYLAIGFSSLDYVGHRFGPNSVEVLDTLLRLDLVVGELLDVLDDEVGAGRFVVALSSDHGVMPLPEVIAGEVAGARRLDASDGICFQALEGHLDAAFGSARWLLSGLYLDHRTVASVDGGREAVEREAKRHLEGCKAVRRVWTRSEIEAEASSGGVSEHEQYYRNGFHAGRSPDLFVQLEEHRLAKLGSGTTHGSPYAYDSHVPMWIAVPGLPAESIARPVHTVDLAPTLAELVSVPVPEALDGKSRAGLLGRTVD